MEVDEDVNKDITQQEVLKVAVTEQLFPNSM